MIYKTILSCFFFTSVLSTEHVFLKTPDISKENIIGTTAGIRPFRKTGVRIETESIEDKLIIHNYGYGSSGLTLSFGGVREVLDILDHHKITPQNVAILGAGIAGMTTAYDLLERGYKVCIYSDEWPPNLTSNVAEGLWTPLTFPKDLSEEKQQLHLRMLNNSKCRFLKSTCNTPEFKGVGFIPSYSFKTELSQTPNNENDIVVHFDNGIIKKGKEANILAIDGKIFFNDLSQKLKNNGVRLKQIHFESLKDILALDETVIINCTSMGSIKLFNDHDFFPIRGQLVYFKPQPDFDYLYSHHIDNDGGSKFFVSMHPWSDRIILGGVWEYDENEAEVTPKVIDTLIENAQKCLSGKL